MNWHGVILARVAGIPIRLHGTLLIALPLMLLQFPLSLWPLGLALMAGLFGSVALHELGHSLVALRYGCRAQEIVLLPIGGMARMDCLPRSPRHEIRIAAAGPAVSFALASLCAILRGPNGVAPSSAAAALLEQLQRVNLMLALFNLIPSFPMDGGRIFRAWLSPWIGRLAATRLAAWIGQGFAIALVLWALWPPVSLLTAALGLFLYHAARMEWEATLHQELFSSWWSGMHEWWGWRDGEEPMDPVDEVIVSPPPYRRQSLFQRWWRRRQVRRLTRWEGD
ncbi:MAG: site-2 protease family protein [Kiritimatiellae bacterium]|nr:site-2 protease family protein [Kiritimatiellia bacterium]